MPATANELLQDLGIRHAVYFQRLATHEVNRVIAFLNGDVFPDMLRALANGLTASRRSQLSELLQVLRGQLAGAAAELDRRVGEAMTIVAQAEADWQRRTVMRAMPVEVDWKSPTAGYLRATATSQPFAGDVLSGWFSRLAADTGRRLEKTIAAGLAEGESIPDLIARVRGKRSEGYVGGVLETTRRNAAAIVRTAANHVSNATRQETYRENRNIVKGWKFVATLDTRTTLICQTLDGSVFAIDDQTKAPPRHYG